MKTFATILALAAAVAVARASCPNACSGHGTCNSDDQCMCWQGFEGYDCSQRTCPYVEAWAVDNAEDAHFYAECAGKGICDRTTGLCECFDGYEGRGCERSSCPNACSGHGKCRMIADLEQYVVGKGRAGGWTAYSWDEKAITSCVCDGGFMGPDCSQRICPFGDDPMTTCEEGETEQVQKVVFSIPGDFTGAAYVDSILQNNDISVTFKSYANETFNTKAADFVPTASTLGTTDANAAGLTTNSAPRVALLATALETIPNFRVRDVSVTASSTGAATKLSTTYEVTFHHEDSGNNYGRQNLLMCPSARTVGSGVTTYGCGAAGCQPLILQPRVVALAKAGGAATTTLASHDVAAGNEAVWFTSSSVLTCPMGVTCSNAQPFQGGVAFLLATESAGKTHMWAKGVGASAALTTAYGNLATFALAAAFAGDFATNGFTYIGVVEKNPSTATDVYTVDISNIMADTAVSVNLATYDTDNAAAPVAAYALQYNTATCELIADITHGDTSSTSSGEPHQNYDAENIECSGRGQCDRSAGICKCFEGFFGSNCGSQTILV